MMRVLDHERTVLSGEINPLGIARSR
jgi:hypothetical protein